MAKIKDRMTREELLTALIEKARQELGIEFKRTGLNALIGSHVATVPGAWTKVQALIVAA